MDQPTVEPPTYAATTSPKRSIQDLRAQILAHGTIMRPRNDPHYGSEDHIELIVAKTPAYASTKQASRSPNFDEKKKMVMREDGTLDYQLRGTTTASSSQELQANGNKHYAVLLRRSNSVSKVRVIIKGEPKDTVEEALEWMLERTEMVMHDMIVKSGTADEDECSIM